MSEPRKSFVFFSSWERYLKTLELDKDINYVNAVARAIIQYGIAGEVESADPTILSRVEAVCADLMQSSTARYNRHRNSERRRKFALMEQFYANARRKLRTPCASDLCRS